MPIDFFTSPCTKTDGNCQMAGVICATVTNQDRFGISDANSNLRRPAEVRFNNPSNWDFTIINNSNNKLVHFKAIDFCVDIYRTGTYSLNDDNRTGNQFSSDNVNSVNLGLIKRCEGFLTFDSSILFIEIKRRTRGNWLKDAREKFEETILSFKEHNPNSPFKIIEPIVSNALFNRLHQSEMVQKKTLKDKVGVELKIQKSFEIV